MLNKHWPVRITSKIAADAMKMCELDRLTTVKLNKRLLREHQKYMTKAGDRWLRAEETIKNIEAQL